MKTGSAKSTIKIFKCVGLEVKLVPLILNKCCICTDFVSSCYIVASCPQLYR